MLWRNRVSIRARHCWRANRSRDFKTGKSTEVSIRARHCWRANPGEDKRRISPFDVSIRARHCWRANQVLTVYNATIERVSIRARHCWRANPARPCHPGRHACFNPRPPLLAGESWLGVGLAGIRKRFNPRPPLLAGESVAHGQHAHYVPFQSAPAIAGGRIDNRQRGHAHHAPFQSAPAIAGGRISAEGRPLRSRSEFQSAPAIAGGRIQRRAGLNARLGVSIRARHCWRANRRTRLHQSTHGRRFNPRPPLLAGESGRRAIGRCRHQRFQSAPAIAGGRISAPWS